MLEYWNNGTMGSGNMEQCLFRVIFIDSKNNNRIVSFENPTFQYSIIPFSHW
jgi:hypothetical protein